MNKRLATGETAMEITLQLDPDIQCWLDRIVKEHGHNHEYWLMELARIGRENLEDSLLADEAMMELKASGGKTVPIEEVMRKYGI